MKKLGFLAILLFVTLVVVFGMILVGCETEITSYYRVLYVCCLDQSCTSTGNTVDLTYYKSGSTAIVMENEFVKAGYVFQHWSRSSAGLGHAYYPGEEIEVTRYTYLYAVWEPVE